MKNLTLYLSKEYIDMILLEPLLLQKDYRSIAITLLQYSTTIYEFTFIPLLFSNTVEINKLNNGTIIITNTKELTCKHSTS